MNCIQYYLNDTKLDTELREALLNRCIRRRAPYADKVEVWWLKERKGTFSYENRDFNDLVKQMSSYLAVFRPQLLEGFNEPVGQVEFDRFERETGLILPREYKSLLGWRGGQIDHFEDYFDPFGVEALMSLQHAREEREYLNELIEDGSLPEGHWDHSWLPFTEDGLGNHTCIDLTPETYGEVLIFDLEIGGRIRHYENMTAWLAELMDKLEFEDEIFLESKCFSTEVVHPETIGRDQPK